MFNPVLTKKRLFDLIKAAVSTEEFGFKRISTKLRPWSNTGIENQPALYLVSTGIKITQANSKALPVYQMHFCVIIQSRASSSPADDDSSPDPDDLLNGAFLAITQALAGPLPGERQTLNGVVNNVWIEGDAPLIPGYLDPQCEMQIPIEALTGA